MTSSMTVWVIVTSTGDVLGVYDNEKAADEHSKSLDGKLDVRTFFCGVRSV